MTGFVCRRLGHEWDDMGVCTREHCDEAITTPGDGPHDAPDAPAEPGHCDHNPEGDLSINARSGDGHGYDHHCEWCREDYSDDDNY